MAALGVSMGVGLDTLGGVQGLLVAVALSCSLAMSLPISTPPNALAYSTGFVQTKIAKIERERWYCWYHCSLWHGSDSSWKWQLF